MGEFYPPRPEPAIGGPARTVHNPAFASCALLGYCAASSGDSLTTVRDTLPKEIGVYGDCRPTRPDPKTFPSWPSDNWQCPPKKCICLQYRRRQSADIRGLCTRTRAHVRCRLRLKCDGTRAETRFCLSAKRTNPFKSAGGRQFSWLLAAEVCASAVVMLDTPCSEVVWRVLATHCIRQFPLHFPSRLPSHFNWTLQTFATATTYSVCSERGFLSVPLSSSLLTWKTKKIHYQCLFIIIINGNYRQID